MQNYEQILAELEIEIPEDKKEPLRKAWNQNYKTIADYNKQVEKAKRIKSEVEEAKRTLVFCSAIHKINHSGTNNVNILNHHIITRSTQCASVFPLLRKSHQCSQLVASYGPIKVHCELQRLGHNVEMAL